MNKTTACAILAVTLSLTASDAQAASFNCAYAKLPAEVAICNDEELGSLDVPMSRLYYSDIHKLPWEQVTEVKAEQKAFIKERNACGSDDVCITDSYNARIERLNFWADWQG